MSYAESRQKGVASFVHDTGRDAYWKALAAFRESLCGTQGAVRPELLEDVSCAVCGPAERTLAFTKDGLDYVRCAVCGSLFVAPQLRAEIVDEFWHESPVAAQWLDVLLAPAQLEFDRAKFRGVLARVEAERGVGRILDIGCSIGSFLEVARSRGWEITGVEPGARARQRAAATYGIDLHPDLDEVSGTFDVVTFWEVVEHVKDPAGLLHAARSRLADDGLVVALVGGNAGSIANRVMRASSAAFDFARLWYFTPDSFGRLLSHAGLRQTRVEPVLAEVDTLMNYLSYGDPYAPASGEDVLSEDAVAALQRLAETPAASYKFLSHACPESAGE